MNYAIMPGLKVRPKFKVSSGIIVDTVLGYFNLQMNDLTGKKRYRNFVIARHIIFYLLRNEYGMTLKEIGVMFNRDHTTVINGCKSIGDLMYTKNPELVKCFDEVKALLK